jgi:hypothetical protein
MIITIIQGSVKMAIVVGWWRCTYGSLIHVYLLACRMGTKNASYCILLTTKIYLLTTKGGGGRTHFSGGKNRIQPTRKARHNNPCVTHNEKREGMTGKSGCYVCM